MNVLNAGNRDHGAEAINSLRRPKTVLVRIHPAERDWRPTCQYQHI
jgi:hypothetical protein